MCPAYFVWNWIGTGRSQFGVPQEVPGESDELHEQTLEVINGMVEYMRKIWEPTTENNFINYKCRNMDKLCAYWAADECGDDDPNVDWMQSNCAPACRTCHLLDTRLRCPIEEGNECVLKPGGLNALMEGIVDDANGTGEYLKYTPKALSRPRVKADGTTAPGGVQDGPW